jgi:hypothetical protein
MTSDSQLEQQINDAVLRISSAIETLDAYKMLHRAAVIAGNKGGEETARQQCHDALDAMLDAQASLGKLATEQERRDFWDRD